LVGTVVRLLGSYGGGARGLDSGSLSFRGSLRLDFADQVGYALPLLILGKIFPARQGE
jgi:hypothetical protein